MLWKKKSDFGFLPKNDINNLLGVCICMYTRYGYVILTNKVMKVTIMKLIYNFLFDLQQLTK